MKRTSLPLHRRKFIALVGAAWPFAASGQQPDRLRRIGVLMLLSADDIRGQTFLAAFVEKLRQLGWTEGRNAQIDIHWTVAEADAGRVRSILAELIALMPDVILASGAAVMGPLLEVTRSIPIVFVLVPDPVGAGFVDSLARPGGNATGFLMFEYAISAKWLELLKQVAPGVTRVAVVRDPTNPAVIGQWGAIQAVAPSFGVDLTPVNVREAREIEGALAAFASKPNGGLIVTASASAGSHRELIIALAARHKLPATYYEYNLAVAGGLLSYGPDFADQYRQAASYVDRILKGEKPGNLPVQVPTKYALTINLKTAKALGLTLPPSLLARADDVID
jgi:putative ABC transport system substrate-binding protein